MSPAPTPKPRRRIAGEVKPAVASSPETPAEPQPTAARSKLPKPKLPKREKPSPPPPAPTQPPSAASDLPAAPARFDSAPGERRRPSNLVLALVVLTIVSLGFAGFGIWRGVEEMRGNNVAEARAAATDAAASASEKIFSYKYTELDEHLREAKATMTPRFATKFQAVAPALNALAPQRKIQVKAVVRHAAPKECGDSCSPLKATVLIFVDQARLTADAEKPVVFGNRIEVFMVERKGKWLVNHIKAL